MKSISLTICYILPKVLIDSVSVFVSHGANAIRISPRQEKLIDFLISFFS